MLKRKSNDSGPRAKRRRDGIAAGAGLWRRALAQIAFYVKEAFQEQEGKTASRNNQDGWPLMKGSGWVLII